MVTTMLAAPSLPMTRNQRDDLERMAPFVPRALHRSVVRVEALFGGAAEARHSLPGGVRRVHEPADRSITWQVPTMAKDHELGSLLAEFGDEY